MRNFLALIFLSCASFLSCAVEVTHQCADECVEPVAACEVVAYGVHAVCDLEESYTPFETQCTPDNIGQSFTQSVDIGRGQTCFLHTYRECADGTRTDVVIDSIGSLVPILIPDAPERLLAYLPGELSVMHVDSNSNVGEFNGFIGTTIDLDAAGNNRLVVVNTGIEFTGTTGDVPATVEINGVSIIANLIASSVGATFRVEWAYYAFEADLPATAGTYDVDVTFTGAVHTNKEVEAITVDYYTGIDQAGLVDFGEDRASSKVGSGGASVTPDSTNYLIVGGVLTGGTAAHTWTSSAGTPVKTEEAFNAEGGISTAHVFGTDDTSDQDLSWTVSPTVRYGMVVGIFNVAAASGHTDLIGETGSYVVTGNDVGLIAARTLAANTGAYSLTGNNVNLLAQRVAVAGTGNYTLTGNAVNFIANLLLQAEAGNYSLSGNDVNLIAASLMDGEAGSYSLNGNDIALIANRLMQAASGSYLLSGNNVNAIVARLLDAESGSYALDGNDIAILTGNTLNAETGSYSFSGNSIGLFASRSLVAELGSYALNGNDVEFSVEGTSLDAETGAFSLVGFDAELLKESLLNLETGSYSLSGNDVDFVYGRTIDLAMGSYSVVGFDTEFSKLHRLVGDAGSYVVTGSSVNLIYSGSNAFPDISGKITYESRTPNFNYISKTPIFTYLH